MDYKGDAPSTLKPQSTGFGRTALLSTDNKGSVLFAADESHAYAPFGYLNDLKSHVLYYNGQLPDALTQRYPLGNGYRHYSVPLMRFICPDSLSPFGAGGINAYAYCAGDPINRTDESGHTGILTPLNPRASRNPFSGFENWKSYPGISSGQRKHILKLEKRINKARRFAEHINNNPEAHDQIESSNSRQRYESNRKKIETSFLKLEEGRSRWNTGRQPGQPFDLDEVPDVQNIQPTLTDPLLDPPPTYSEFITNTSKYPPASSKAKLIRST